MPDPVILNLLGHLHGSTDKAKYPSKPKPDQHVPYLPAEIIAQIAACLPTKSALCYLALCSSRFYDLTIPILYAHGELYGDRCWYENCLFVPRLRAVTVLFLQKPALALCVWHFTLRYTSRDGFECVKHDGEVADIEGVLKEAIYALTKSTTEYEDWIHTLGKGHPTDALLALLLPTMAELKNLDFMLGLSTPYLDRMILKAIARKKPFDIPPLFPGLTDYMHAESPPIRTGSLFHPAVSHEVMSSQYLKSFLAWPSIGSISGHGLSNGHMAFRVDNIDAPLLKSYKRYNLTLNSISSSLTHLELKKSALTKEDSKIILKIPKALNTFIYEYSPSQSHAFFDGNFGDVLLALVPQYDSLQNLWLDYEDIEGGPEQAYLRDEIPPLSNFRHLKHLRVPGEVLYSIFGHTPDGTPQWPTSTSRPFPETLEILHFNQVIIETFLKIWEGLRKFLHAGLSQVPRLRTVFIDCSSTMDAP